MAVSFFIPKRINVGYQERRDTYTNKLAYVIYFDEKGKLRKETSWNSWRKKELGNDIFPNEPTSGFVLNKKAGGYSSGWNHRQTYVRVYDPRGFEFEIGVANLLYILENATSTKGKGLEGDFVYGWDGKELVLIPCESPDYKELEKLNELRHSNKRIGARDLKLGATYRTKDNYERVYLGKFDEYHYGKKMSTKSFFFGYTDSKGEYNFSTIKSVPGQIVECINEDAHPEYADMIHSLEHSTIFSPIDESKSVYIPYTLEEVKSELVALESKWGSLRNCRSFKDDNWVSVDIYKDHDKKGEECACYTYLPEKVTITRGYGSYAYEDTSYRNVKVEFDTVEELMDCVKPHRKIYYLANGNKYGESRY